MRGLLLLSEGARAHACNVENGDLETAEDVTRLNRYVTEQCFELLYASGGDRYRIFLDKLRKEQSQKKIVISPGLSEDQNKELDQIFMPPTSQEEKVLRSKFVRAHVYFCALEAVQGRDKALAQATLYYPLQTIVKW